MSATIADDSEIVRTFDASPAAIEKPISSTSFAGVGERMILVPGLMKLTGYPISGLIKHIALEIAKSKSGVVVLVPSREAGKSWKDVAAAPKTTEDASNAVSLQWTEVAPRRWPTPLHVKSVEQRRVDRAALLIYC